MDRIHRVFLVPGFFGFGRLGGVDYFRHVIRGLGSRFDAAGVRWSIEVAPPPPTASIKRRARTVADAISRLGVRDDDLIHIVGHSTGGLDARLIACPHACLDLGDDEKRIRDRLASVTTISTPHHGTPLARFFATVSGARLLYAISLMTVTTLSVGAPPLAAISTILASLQGLDDAVGIRVGLYDEGMRMLLRLLGDKGRTEVTRWLEGIGDDQGALAQLTPEAMDIFNIGITNASGVRYGSIVNASPAPKTRTFAAQLRHPLDALSAPIYATIYGVTASEHAKYKAPVASALTRERFLERMPFEVTGRANDGVVPALSMVWGDVIWAGPGDHLDVIGHFYGGSAARDHVDWISSGAKYGLPEFDSQMDAMARHVLSA